MQKTPYPAREKREVFQPNGPKIEIVENQPPCTVYAEGGKFYVPKEQILPKLHALLPPEDRRAYQIRMTRGMCGETTR